MPRPLVRPLALVAALALPLLALLPPLATPARAADTWEVQVGGDDEASAVSAMAAFPSPLTVRVGDTVDFRFAGFHTVTFNSGQPDLPLLVPGPGPGELAFGRAFFPAGPAGPDVTYDGTQQVSSGVPPQGPPYTLSYRVTFTRPGVFGYVCALHPGMHGEVAVREAGGPLPETPAQARERGQSALPALLGLMRAQRDAVPAARNGTVQAATAGLGSAAGASAVQFLNGDLTVRRGDTVVWTAADPFDLHTVTFLSGGAAPEFGEPRPGAPPGGPPQVVLRADVAGPAGGGVYTGQGYVTSGILALGAPYALRFEAPAGVYDYLCLVHPVMRARVTVVD